MLHLADLYENNMYCLSMLLFILNCDNLYYRAYSYYLINLRLNCINIQLKDIKKELSCKLLKF